MSLSLKEKLENLINSSPQAKNATEEDKKFKPPRLVRPRWFKFSEERGFLHYIAIGAASGLLGNVKL